MKAYASISLLVCSMLSLGMATPRLTLSPLTDGLEDWLYAVVFFPTIPSILGPSLSKTTCTHAQIGALTTSTDLATSTVGINLTNLSFSCTAEMHYLHDIVDKVTVPCAMQFDTSLLLTLVLATNAVSGKHVWACSSWV